MPINTMIKLIESLGFGVPGYRISVPSGVRHNADDIISILNWLPTILIVVGLFLGFIFTLYAGYMWITAEGDKTKIENVRKTVMYVVIGLIVILTSFFVLRFIGEYIIGNAKVVNLNNTPSTTEVPCRPGYPC